jgi:hypothetical protein
VAYALEQEARYLSGDGHDGTPGWLEPLPAALRRQQRDLLREQFSRPIFAALRRALVQHYTAAVDRLAGVVEGNDEGGVVQARVDKAMLEVLDLEAASGLRTPEPGETWEEIVARNQLTRGLGERARRYMQEWEAAR